MKKYFFYIFLNVVYLCEGCEEYCENCCDCIYSGEIVKDPSGNGLLIKKNGKVVVKLETLQGYIDNIVKVIKFEKLSRSTLLCGKSIFEKPTEIKWFEEERKKKNKIFANINSGFLNFSDLSSLEKKCIGSMLGMGIGDAYGSVFEFMKVDKKFFDAANYNLEFDNNIEWKRDKHSNCKGWTDDASMGLCIADSLIVKQKFDPVDIMRRFLAWWYCGYNNASMYQKTKMHSWGLGGNINASFENYISNPVDFTTAGNQYTSGNGSIMRNAAIPIAYHNKLDLAMDYAGKQSKVTHQGNEAAGCCKLLTYIVWNILNDNKKNTLKETLDLLLTEKNLNDVNLVTDSVKGLALSKESVKSDKDKNSLENWNWKNKTFKYNTPKRPHDSSYLGAYAMDNMAMSLHILYHTTSFDQAINVAVHMGGDADSVASVVGQIAGVFYGVDKIPVEWIKKLYVFDNGDFTLKALLLAHLFDEES